MILNLAYTTLEEYNQTGVDNLLMYVASNLPIFVPLIIGCFGLILFIGTYLGQSRVRGEGDWASSFMVATTGALGMTVILAQKDGLVTPILSAIVTAIFIVSLIAIFMTRRREY